MTHGGSTYSGFRIASTLVITREKNSYADVVRYIEGEDSYADVGVLYTRVIMMH